jgi:hypothetical protein
VVEEDDDYCYIVLAVLPRHHMLYQRSAHLHTMVIDETHENTHVCKAEGMTTTTTIVMMKKMMMRVYLFSGFRLHRLSDEGRHLFLCHVVPQPVGGQHQELVVRAQLCHLNLV